MQCGRHMFSGPYDKMVNATLLSMYRVMVVASGFICDIDVGIFLLYMY